MPSRTVHGFARRNQLAVEFTLLKNINQRCFNPKNPGFPNYGGRGIGVCERWQGPFGVVHFIEDMGRRPSPAHSIDRIDNDKDYCKENCRWATRSEQSLNSRRTRKIILNGEQLKLCLVSRENGIPPEVVRQRIDTLHWSIEDAVTIPHQPKLPKRFLTCNGVTKSIKEWAKETGIKRKTISQRINALGWSPERALTTVVDRHGLTP